MLYSPTRRSPELPRAYACTFAECVLRHQSIRYRSCSRNTFVVIVIRRGIGDVRLPKQRISGVGVVIMTNFGAICEPQRNYRASRLD